MIGLELLKRPWLWTTSFPGSLILGSGEVIGRLRTFALIVSARPYCARKSTCHVMPRARALSTEMNNDREDGHCYSFDWI